MDSLELAEKNFFQIFCFADLGEPTLANVFQIQYFFNLEECVTKNLWANHPSCLDEGS